MTKLITGSILVSIRETSLFDSFGGKRSTLTSSIEYLALGNWYL